MYFHENDVFLHQIARSRVWITTLCYNLYFVKLNSNLLSESL